MADQTRWWCPNCQREWVWAHAWSAEAGCPACQALDIVQRTYTPAFPGADIPRDDAAPVLSRPVERVPVEQRNLTLAMSSPEFG